MPSTPVAREAFSKYLDNNQLKVLQIVYFALAMGVSTFAFVVYFLHTQNGDVPPPEDSAVPLMTNVHFVVLIAAIFLSRFIYDKMFSNISADVMTSPQMIWDKMRSAHIVRLAVLEAPVFIGLVTCLIGSQDGFLNQEPTYWVNLVSLVIFLAFVAMNFPNKDKLLNEFRFRFGRN